MDIPRRFGFPAAMLLVAAFLIQSIPCLGAAEFIRGDSNGDGAVTISDACWIAAHPFHYIDIAMDPCPLSSDADDNGLIDLSDALFLLSSLFLGGAPIPPPFPSPGPDPTPDEVWPPDGPIRCVAYGGGAPLEVPGATLKVLDATVPGGADSEAELWITLSTANRYVAVEAFSARIKFPGGIRGEVVEIMNPPPIDELDPGVSPPLRSARWVRENEIEMIAVYSGLDDPYRSGPEFLDCQGSYPVKMLGIRLCLEDGVTQGEYPVRLEGGELTLSPSSNPGHSATYPALEGGSLVVEEDVSGAEPCDSVPGPNPRRLDAVFRLGSRSAPPGGSAAVPFTIRANFPIEGYRFSVDFEEDVLEATAVEFSWRRPDGAEYSFAWYDIDNEMASDGSGGVDEGYLVGTAVFDISSPPVSMPADTDNPAALLHFRVRPETAALVTEIRFLDGGRDGGGWPIRNQLAAFQGAALPTPETANSFLFMNGRINVIPDVATFVRGDSNGDGTVDMSDAVTTLGFLFLGSPPPACLDAGDLNDDGVLNVSDAVATLAFLFLSGKEPPPPFRQRGLDPTGDPLGCLVSH